MSRKPKAPPAPPRADELTMATLPLADLKPNPRNYRKHPEEQIEQLAASIKEFGQPRPILVRKENSMIVGGHGVSMAMHAAGKTEARVLLWDVDQDTADAFMIADNEHSKNAIDDDEMLAALMRQMDRDDYTALGMDDNRVEKLLDPDKLSGGSGAGAGDGGICQILVDCENEAHQAALLEKFNNEGLQCRALLG